MLIKLRYCRLFVVTVLLAIFLISVFAPALLLVHTIWLKPTFAHLTKLLRDWQTLLAGFWTIGAALLAGYFVLRQIEAAQSIETEKRLARHQAVRAGLPMILSPISECLKTNLALLKHWKFQLEGNAGHSLPKMNMTPFPAGALTYLSDMIEVELNDGVRSLTLLLQQLQILEARILGTIDDARNAEGISAEELKTRSVDIIVVFARVQSLFDYARGRASQPPVKLSQDEVISCALQLLLDDTATDFINEIARRVSFAEASKSDSLL